jgi:hypothetical protein
MNMCTEILASFTLLLVKDASVEVAKKLYNLIITLTNCHTRILRTNPGMSQICARIKSYTYDDNDPLVPRLNGDDGLELS